MNTAENNGLGGEDAHVKAQLPDRSTAILPPSMVAPSEPPASDATVDAALDMLASAVVVDVTQSMPAPPEALATFEGYMDGLDSRWNVVGWARSLPEVEERLTVELVEDGRAVSSDIAIRFRGDLLAAKRGDGRYGFQLAIPTSLFNGMRHSFTVRVAQPGTANVVGQLDIILPSRLPKTAGGGGVELVSAAKLVESVLDGGVAQTPQYLETYILHLTRALEAVVREYDFVTALGLLYIHILRRHIDESGLQTRLTHLSQNPEQLGAVVTEVVYSEEAQSRIKNTNGYHLPDLEAILAWTRLRSII